MELGDGFWFLGDRAIESQLNCVVEKIATRGLSIYWEELKRWIGGASGKSRGGV